MPTLGRAHGVETLIDATLATPYNLRPLDYGVDYVLHSATKYLGGHNDLLAGVIVGRSDKLEPIRNLRGIMGGDQLAAQHLPAGARPEDVRSADAAAQREWASGRRVSGVAPARRTRLLSRAAVASVPRGRATNDARFRRSWSRSWSRTPTGGRRPMSSMPRCIPRIAPSLGGVESLIEQPLVMSYYEATPEERAALGIPDNMIRLACGIENPEDLIADLDQA